MKNFPRINRFYIGMLVIMGALSALVIITMRGIFGVIGLAGEVDEELLSSTAPRLNVSKLDEALRSVQEKEFTALDL